MQRKDESKVSDILQVRGVKHFAIKDMSSWQGHGQAFLPSSFSCKGVDLKILVSDLQGFYSILYPSIKQRSTEVMWKLGLKA